MRFQSLIFEPGDTNSDVTYGILSELENITTCWPSNTALLLVFLIDYRCPAVADKCIVSTVRSPYMSPSSLGNFARALLSLASGKYMSYLLYVIHHECDESNMPDSMMKQTFSHIPQLV